MAGLCRILTTATLVVHLTVGCCCPACAGLPEDRSAHSALQYLAANPRNANASIRNTHWATKVADVLRLLLRRIEALHTSRRSRHSS